MSINNDKKEKKRIVFEFPSDLFGKSKKGNDNTELMKTIKQELKNKEDYKPELTVLEKYKLGIELLLSLSVREFEKAKELIKMGANVNAKDEEGNTSIMFAAQNAPIEILKFLIENDAKINIRNHEGKTPLILAATFNKKEILEFLINNGAQVDETDYAGETPLMYAVSFNCPIDVIETLIKKGAHVNDMYSSGLTILMRAAKYGKNPKIITVLINNGADYKIKSKEGKTALDYANSNKYLFGTPEYNILKELSTK